MSGGIQLKSYLATFGATAQMKYPKSSREKTLRKSLQKFCPHHEYKVLLEGFEASGILSVIIGTPNFKSNSSLY